MSTTWKTPFLTSLQLRDTREKSHNEFITAYTRLANRLSPSPLPSSPTTTTSTDHQQLITDLLTAQSSKTHLQTQLTIAQAEVQSLQAQIRVLEKTAREKERLERRNADLESEGRAKSRAIQDLQDEMLTLTMELNVLADKEKATRAENEELVQRWMDFAETRAEVMNRVSNWE
ncbi:autophagy protein 16 [Choiromyces venosus 120613-1]|uniref:Autophagy protein 16 n=1 Tax=Choiromyces venosus 120613-1 TaxID=1336337 RepID=A0A3N4JI67_9PEZI|nr:autophagy protein 16 [Choiromyces venosus 120613-1]